MPKRSRFVTYGLPLIALAGAVVGGIAITSNRPSSPVAAPTILPPTQPADGLVLPQIGATGVVEAEDRNVSLGAAIAGVVAKVLVQPGQEVKQGAPLFIVDTRDLEAQLAIRNADVTVAERAVEVADAAVGEARAAQANSQGQYERVKNDNNSGAYSKEEVARRKFAAESGLAHLKGAAAQAAEARANLLQARAQLASAQTQIERATVRAPRNGTILQVYVRPGQYAPSGEAQTAVVVIGVTHPLHLRVDVDEVDVPRLILGAPAAFTVRGDGTHRLQARFVRVEPLLVAKTNLSGAANERVDTRVLQILYAFEPGTPGIFIGQQVDAFLPASATAARFEK